MVLDEDMWPRLATELRGRGKQAIALKNTELVGSDDQDLIKTIGSWTDTILLTRDDNMPSEHEGAIASVQLTIAVVAPSSSFEHVLAWVGLGWIADALQDVSASLWVTVIAEIALVGVCLPLSAARLAAARGAPVRAS